MQEIWACQYCTFQNSILNKKCQVCHKNTIQSWVLAKQEEKYFSKENSHDKKAVKQQLVICKQFKFQYPGISKQCAICFFNNQNALDEKKPKQYQDKPQKSRQDSLLCEKCNFQNHKLNQYCVACDAVFSKVNQKQQYTNQINKPCLIPLKQQCPVCGVHVTSEIFQTHVTDCIFHLEILQKNKGNKKVEEENLINFQIDKQIFDEKSFKRLTRTQIDALSHMYSKSRQEHLKSKVGFINRVLKLGYLRNDIEAAHYYLQNYAPIIIHVSFNRDIQFFLKDTHYRNMFQLKRETQYRTKKQDDLFANIYSNSKPFQRVKYGVVNFTNDPKGVANASSYGRSFMLLKQNVRKRCTFTYGNSESRSQVGTFKYSFHILNRFTDRQIQALISGAKAIEGSSSVCGVYKQIQIHGPIQFDKDIQRLYINEDQLSNSNLMARIQNFAKLFKIDFEILKDGSVKKKLKAPRMENLFG